MFDIQKVVQIAAYLLWKNGEGMSPVRLMSMMYLAEKQFLLTYGERLSGDQMVSLPSGPALFKTQESMLDGSLYQNQWISNLGNNKVAFNESISVDSRYPLETFDELSVAEQNVLDSAFEKLNDVPHQELITLMRNSECFPEWESPEGTSRLISCEDLLIKNGKTKQETEGILNKLKEVDSLQKADARLV